ncbi:MAG: hypothetical protein B6D37_07780 [Sphingobacteriales bacterium UTBCD1]|jgi:positive regulator of sigma E activity|nr:MAG: hypothetical protein B6D37_07780 [Sphingobacteriales bacterium UTBCD1]
MKFLSRLRNKIWESAPLFYIVGLINTVIGFFLLTLFIPEMRNSGYLILFIICGLITDYLLRKMYYKKKKNDHQELK